MRLDGPTSGGPRSIRRRDRVVVNVSGGGLSEVVRGMLRGSSAAR